LDEVDHRAVRIARQHHQHAASLRRRMPKMLATKSGQTRPAVVQHLEASSR
jgi:hypothetical protein